MKKFFALVPMKGHSERVPNKNLRLFGGKPLYHHIVSTLISCPYIKSVYIDTDSAAISQDAFTHFPEKVKIIQRPSSICGDFVSMNVIIDHDLTQIDGIYFLQTHSTNPLLETPTLTRAMETWLKHPQYDSLFSVNRYQSRFYDGKGSPINHNPNEMLRTQDLPLVYEENSNLYLFTRESFQKTGRRIGNKPVLFEMPKMESLDIDTEEDFKMAEVLYNYVTKTKN